MSNDEIVKKCYQELVDEAMYDVKKGNEPLTQENLSKPLGEFIDTINDFYEKEKIGCCMVFATRLKKVLEDKGIKTWYALSSEKNGEELGTRGSLLYIAEDETFKILNPVAEIEQKQNPTDRINIKGLDEMSIENEYNEFYNSTDIEKPYQYILILPNDEENNLSFNELWKKEYGIADANEIYANNINKLEIDANGILSGNIDKKGQILLKEIQDYLTNNKSNIK